MAEDPQLGPLIDFCRTWEHLNFVTFRTEPAPTVELPQAPEKKKREVSSISDLSQDYREEEKSDFFGH